jgi:hypothetical protein
VLALLDVDVRDDPRRLESTSSSLEAARLPLPDTVDWTTPLATVAVRRLEAVVWEALPTLVYATTTAPMPSRPRKMSSEGRSLYLGIGSGGERRRGGGRGGAQVRLLWSVA